MNDFLKKQGWQPVLGAVMLALIFFLPSMRAYIPGVPQVSYVVPVFFLVALALMRTVSRPWMGMPLILVVYVTLCTLLFSWLMLSSWWTISSSQYQVDLVLSLSILFLVFACSITLDEQSIELFFRIICGLGLLVGAVVIAEFMIIGSLNASGTLLYGRYLTIAHILGFTATGAAIRYLVPGSRVILWGPVALVLFLVLALSLGRGALLSALLIFSFASLGILFYQLAKNPGYSSWVSGILKIGTTFLLGLGTLTMAMQVGRTKARLLRIFSGNELEEGGRGGIWREALGHIQDSPFYGHGMGSSGLLSSGTEGAHPHNLFLQVWLDGGVIAVILLLVLLLVPLFSFMRNLGKHNAKRDAILFPVVGMYVFLFLEYSKSGSFYTARGLILFGLCIIILAEKILPGRGSIKEGTP